MTMLALVDFTKAFNSVNIKGYKGEVGTYNIFKQIKRSTWIWVIWNF